MKRIAAALLLLLLSLAPVAPPAHAAAPDRIRMIMDPTFYAHLPVLHALDAGYFRAENIDLQITPSPGSSTAPTFTVMPR